MPYKSEAQRRFFNSEKGKEVVGKKNVEKFNKESKGLKLPEKVKEKDETLGEYIKSSFDECEEKDKMLKRRIATMGKANDTNMKILKALDSIEKVEKTFDSKYDVNHAANYLWTFGEGRPTFINTIISEAESYARSKGAKTKDEARKYVIEYASKEFESAYKDLKREVDKILKSGYATCLNAIKRW